MIHFLGRKIFKTSGIDSDKSSESNSLQEARIDATAHC